MAGKSVKVEEELPPVESLDNWLEVKGAEKSIKDISDMEL